VNGADFEDNLSEAHLSESDGGEKDFDGKLKDDSANPFIKLKNDRGKSSDADSWKIRGPSAPHNDGRSSDRSFNSTKLIDGYQDFVVGMQKMMAKKAMEDLADDDEDAPKDGQLSQRNKEKKTQSAKKNKKKARSKSNRDSEKRSSKRATSVSSRSSAPLSAVFDQLQLRLIEDPHRIKEDAAEFDLNISFSGGYVPNTDLSRVDKGQGNPQFQGVDAN